MIYYREREDNIYIPNEIFVDLQKRIAKPAHIAFAYSSYYLVTYLYRYNKYVGIGKSVIPWIKEFLGYNPRNQGIDYLIKKGGVLDQLGYTETTADIPLRLFYDPELRGVGFELLSQFKKVNPDDPVLEYLGYGNIRNFKIKRPVKAFHRHEYSREDGVHDGTFYNVEMTHHIHPYIFLKAMDNKRIGTIGFYLYGYIKWMNDYYHGTYYRRSFANLSKDTMIPSTTLNKYLRALESHGFISVSRIPYVIGRSDAKEASGYLANPKDKIVDEPREIAKREVISYREFIQRRMRWKRNMKKHTNR